MKGQTLYCNSQFLTLSTWMWIMSLFTVIPNGVFTIIVTVLVPPVVIVKGIEFEYVSRDVQIIISFIT